MNYNRICLNDACKRPFTTMFFKKQLCSEECRKKRKNFRRLKNNVKDTQILNEYTNSGIIDKPVKLFDLVGWYHIINKHVMESRL